jgi:hypothetical protein
LPGEPDTTSFQEKQEALNVFGRLQKLWWVSIIVSNCCVTEFRWLACYGACWYPTQIVIVVGLSWIGVVWPMLMLPSNRPMLFRCCLPSMGIFCKLI